MIFKPSRQSPAHCPVSSPPATNPSRSTDRSPSPDAVGGITKDRRAEAPCAQPPSSAGIGSTRLDDALYTLMTHPGRLNPTTDWQRHGPRYGASAKRTSQRILADLWAMAQDGVVSRRPSYATEDFADRPDDRWSGLSVITGVLRSAQLLKTYKDFRRRGRRHDHRFRERRTNLRSGQHR